MIGFLGWVTAVCFGLAILNFFVKLLNRKYISKLGKEKAQLVSAYRKVMKIVVKNHKVVGIVAIICVLIHFTIALISHRILLSGIIAAGLMLSLFCLGFYGAYINKNFRGKWLKIHRVAAFAVLLAILTHAIFKI